MSYLLVQIFPMGSAPSGAMLRAPCGGYTFYPLPNSGPVWTVDDRLWRTATDHPNAKPAAFALEMPEAVVASEALANDQRWLAGVIEAANFWPVGSDEERPLPDFSNWQAETRIKSANSLGFDVVDSMGLSGLTNVGSSPEDVRSFTSLRLAGNENGLLVDADSARRFAEFVGNVAPEHAPFVGVEVFEVSRQAHGT